MKRAVMSSTMLFSLIVAMTTLMPVNGNSVAQVSKLLFQIASSVKENSKRLDVSEKTVGKVTRRAVQIASLADLNHKHLHDLSKRVAERYGKLEQLVVKGTSSVAFSAMAADSTKPLTGQVIVFPNALLNEGQGYNVKTGVFTAPMKGLYAFHLTILTDFRCGCTVTAMLKANDKMLAYLVATDRHYHDQSSTSAVVQLEKGDQVKPVADYVTRGKGMGAGRANVFSGYLIRSL